MDMKSNCTTSFYRNDLEQPRLKSGKCLVKNCKVNVKNYKPFPNKKVLFCPEHGIRIHSTGFVYYNGPTSDGFATAIKRNLMFNSNYYINHFLNEKGHKINPKRFLYHENSEDAVSYNVFSELFANGGDALKKLVNEITNQPITDDVDLYLWGCKIDLKNNSCVQYEPLIEVRKDLEKDIKPFVTEPDIMLVIPQKVVICIEAKFGSKNTIAKTKDQKQEENNGEKPKSIDGLIEKYCKNNKLIDTNEIFDFTNLPQKFYEQLFRNIVFAATMAKKFENNASWYVVNLRNQHIMNLKSDKPESAPIVRNIRSILQPEYKKRFTQFTWEDIYNKVIKKEDYKLANLIWYLKNKSFNCGRAFNIL